MASLSPQCLGLVGVLFLSFGVLFTVMHGKTQPTCNFGGVVETCEDTKAYTSDVDMELESWKYKWHTKAQELRNKSEIAKCEIEKNLLTGLQTIEHQKARLYADQAEAMCQSCVAIEYIQTTPPPEPFDCTFCNRICAVVTWTRWNYSCATNKCVWLPQCDPLESGIVLHPKCAECPECHRPICSTTSTVTSSTTTTTTSKTTSTSSSTTRSTTTTTPPTTTTTSSSTSTTTSTTSPITTSTTTTTTSTSTSTSTTTTTSTSTSTSSSRTTSTSSTSTSTRSTTSTTTPYCLCPATWLGYFPVGPPLQVVYPDKKWHQDISIETTREMKNSDVFTLQCKTYFNDRQRYRQIIEVADDPDFPDLGCGYQGSFTINCKCTSGKGFQAPFVDLSTCVPPDYMTVLDQCYTPPTTTTLANPTAPSVPPFLRVVDKTFDLPEPEDFTIPTPPTAEGHCCAVHVGNTCRQLTPAWDAQASYNRTGGYFPSVRCDEQQKPQGRPCHMVDIEMTRNIGNQYPKCWQYCQVPPYNCSDFSGSNTSEAQTQKIGTMTSGRAELRAWTMESTPFVTETVNIQDCIDHNVNRLDIGPSQMWQGHENLLLRKKCRQHGCRHDQCIRTKQRCSLHFFDDKIENSCPMYPILPQFECFDKENYMYNDEVSYAFGITWFILAGCAFAGMGVAFAQRYMEMKKGGKIHPSDLKSTLD